MTRFRDFLSQPSLPSVLAQMERQQVAEKADLEAVRQMLLCLGRPA